jgi:hypothetical protein
MLSYIILELCPLENVKLYQNSLFPDNNFNFLFLQLTYMIDDMRFCNIAYMWFIYLKRTSCMYVHVYVSQFLLNV